ncbi:hypothetical protein SISSUDRAFT_1125704 [Sistotremastrum suecicum HHB10207 ss-3]|uniref:F-box domain-containing protein n=1 Tax=Sistotremastrum suecicum HHB10207 ss-3 TaxID=1314776 RepID=A0A166H2E4_9AGAM|nr:hypothetical protein SISSUDRAFT_1125704 [Sistotremastrum suecicum HHB10207 ss-3]
MRVNPNIHTIAPELVLEILRDECLSTLVSIAQVSSRLYTILKNNRSIWMNSPDIHDLPIPVGETLSTIPNSLFLRLAMRAVDIRSRLEAPIATPIRYSKISEPGKHLTAFLPSGDWVIASHCERLWIRNIRRGDLGLDSEPIFVARGKIQDIKFESVGFGKAILVFTINDWPSRENSPSETFILNLSFPSEESPEADPHITRVQNYTLPNSFSVVALHGPLLVILDTTLDTTETMSLNRFGIIDYQQGFGTEFSVDLPSFADGIGVEGLVPTITRLQLHTELKKLVIHVVLQNSPGLVRNRRAILLADIPRITPLVRSNLLMKSRELLWSQEKLKLTHSYLIPGHLVPSLLDGSNESTLSQYVPIDEFVVDRYGEMASPFDTENMVSVRFDPTRTEDPFRSFPFILKGDPDDAFYAHFTREHSAHFGSAGKTENLLDISCFNASCTRRSRFRIALPHELTGGQMYFMRRVDPSEGRIVLFIFEDEKPRVGSLYLVQY